MTVDERNSTNDPPLEERYPSVELAYDLAVKSSTDVLLKRFEVVEGRIRALATFAPTFTFAAVVFVRSLRPEANLTSQWLMVALLIAAVITLCGVVFPTWGEIRVLHPMELYENYLHLSPWEFKKDVLYFAAKNYATNSTRLERKAWVANSLAVLLVIEVAFLIGWSLQ